MMDILNPPQNYVDFRCETHGKDGPELDEAKRKFYKSHDCRHEIQGFCNRLQRARSEISLPMERVEIFEGDHRKHGRIETMMIWDIEYWRENGDLKKRKIYMCDQR